MCFSYRELAVYAAYSVGYPTLPTADNNADNIMMGLWALVTIRYTDATIVTVMAN